MPPAEAVRAEDTAAPESGRALGHPPRARAPRFYRLDSRAVTLREYWWGHPGLVLVGALLKLLRVRLPASADDPCVESLSPLEVDEAALDDEARRMLAPLQQELAALGFHSPIHHVIEDDVHQTETRLVTFAHESGRAWARIHWRRWTFPTPPKLVLFTELVTPYANGTFLWSLSSKADMLAPGTCRVVRKAGASPTELWRAHQAALQERHSARRAIIPVATPEAVRASLERHHAAVRAFHVRRGVFVPLNRQEHAEAARYAASRKAARAIGCEHPHVVAEIERLQARPASGMNTILLLIVSAALFLGASATGAAPLSLSYLAILVPLLLFHEAGHWLAMRGFGYRNLKMFFIPFLGAAVSGRHYNVPAWKKAVVSLMGPVPGIVLGALLGVFGLLLAKPLLVRIALTALVLNGINLLPILPLDGGWVVQAVLASRSVLFEVVFRGLAVCALLAAGFLLGDVALKVLGFLMLAGMPLAWKLARITGALRHAELEPVSLDEDKIHPATSAAIVGKVAQAFPKGVNSRQLAQFSLTVFEALNARPPRLVASLGLAAVQIVGLLGAVVFTVALALGQGSGLGNLMQAGTELPTATLDPDAIDEWQAPQSESLVAAPHNVVVASFGSAAEAAEAAREVARRAAARAATLTFGQSLLLALPASDDAARQQWLAAFHGTAQDVFVATPATPALVQLSCLAGSEPLATTIETEAGDYFLAQGMHLVPPWMHPDPRSADERLAHTRARRTYARLAQWPSEVFKDPRFLELPQKQQAALKAGDTRRSKQLAAEQERLVVELRRAYGARVMAAPDGDPRVAEAWTLALDGAAARPGPGESGEPDQDDLGGFGFLAPAQLTSIAPLLGQLPAAAHTTGPTEHALSAMGVLTRTGLLLNMPFIRFESSYAGPPAMVRWLRTNGCTDFRYKFSMGSNIAEESQDQPS